MKKIVLAFLTGILLLSAVEWEYEQVVDESGLPAYLSILTLDRNETPHILFTANDAEEKVNILRFAQHVGENWQIRDVAAVPQHKNLTFSFDFNPVNEVVIAYNDSVPAGEMDIFLAIDDELAFDYVNLTDDALLQLDPVVHVGTDGVVRLIYREQNDDGFNIRYGWYSGEAFFSESIRDSMSTHLRGYDFVLDEDNEPHVFFQGDDFKLWYATRVGANDWSNTSLEIRGNQPSVMMDSEGNFHIGYENPPSVYYVTNALGSWTEEMAQEGSGDPGWIHPSLALDPEGIPHITWFTWFAPYSLAAAMEVWYGSRSDGSWSEGIPLPPELDKMFGYVNPFHIDSEGYGHICYTIFDVYYVKTTEPLTEGVSEQPITSNPFDLKIRGSAVHFSLPASGTIRLDLYDACGRLVSHLVSGSFEAGDHFVPLNTSDLASGVYFIRAEIAERSANAKFVLTR